jgi:RHS repeat-associated protein
VKPFFSHFQRSKLIRPAAVVMTTLMVNATVPAWALVPKADPHAPKVLKVEAKKAPASRKLKASEMRKMKGKLLGNPYTSGSAKFDLTYKGVNMRTGDYSLSANDLSYEGGYGIPVSVARSYSANCIDEGPFGVGWTLSADMRTTAGGMLKSGSAPVRSVPVNIKMRHDEESDPNLETDPVKAVVVTDSEGTETTIQVDVDGILTTPPWEKNEYDAAFEVIWVGDAHYEILISNKTKTPDGTVYEYEKKGTYTSGVMPWNELTSITIDPEPSNVLKVVSATDRNGNETTFTYSGSSVTFQKSNGVTSETPLTRVDMPNGRFIEFDWDGNRIIEATDNERSVIYGYNGSDQLTSVTSPGGRITRYGYGYAKDGADSNVGDDSLLTSITDPRGLVTTIKYALDNYTYTNTENRVIAYMVTTPDGRDAHFSCVNRNGMYPSDHVSGGAAIADPGWVFEFATGTVTPTLKEFSWKFDVEDGNYITTERSATTKSFLYKTYDGDSLNLIHERSLYGTGYGITGNYLVKETEKSYNFMGNPLKEVVTELDASNDPTKSYETDYAYWGEEKYFQQKAIRVKLGTSAYRYSFTDYFDTSAAVGKKGQLKRIYDDKNCDYIVDTGISAPSHAVTGGYAWKYQLRPDDANDYASEFDYDTQGRLTDAWKLHKIVSGTRSYVQTRSTYGSTGSPVYGDATSVTEDYGTSKINRTTETLEFDVAGRPIHTRDPMGREFETVYDGDGNVLSLTRTDCTPAQAIATYSYGTTDGEVENGQVIVATDEVSEVVQSVEYAQSGAAIAKPISTVEVDGIHSYEVTFGYNAEGCREAITVDSPDGITKWRYFDWITVGAGSSTARVFSKMNRQEYVGSSWIDSEEQFDYLFSGSGALLTATFAMTPQNGEDDYSSYTADSRARAVYGYDVGGRVTSIEYFWDTLDGSTYDSERVWAADSSYDHPLSIRDSAGFFEPNNTGTAWQLQRRETYEYENATGYLTDVDYNFGALQGVSWDYDAAGNRISDSSNSGSWSYDNLNRIVSSPMGGYTHDLLGERLTGPGQDFEWTLNGKISNHNDDIYSYRPDGQTTKIELESGDTKRYYYCGNFPIATSLASTSGTTFKRFAVGLRSVDAIYDSNGALYPIYDVGGNQKALLSRSGVSSYSVAAWKAFDAWGNLIDGVHDDTAGFGASAGYGYSSDHTLIQMPGRWYEPETGRFLSEDPHGDGKNWYVYGHNAPVTGSDPSGHSWNISQMAYWLGILASMSAIGMLFSAMNSKFTAADREMMILSALYAANLAIMFFGESLGNALGDHCEDNPLVEIGGIMGPGLIMGGVSKYLMPYVKTYLELIVKSGELNRLNGYCMVAIAAIVTAAFMVFAALNGIYTEEEKDVGG